MTAPVPQHTHETVPGPDPGAAPRPALSRLRFVGLSEDGTHLHLIDEEGAAHLLAVEDRLRAAVRPAAVPASSARGMEKTMESMLRPRDIQARIRSGETPEAVAEAAQTSVEKIMPFAAPVLAEREHVAERAQRSSVRRSEGAAPAGARTLGDAVAAHLRGLNVDPESVSWDAWRREDGRWALTGEYAVSERSGAARLTFDARGNYVTLDNDDARWLVGEVVSPAVPVPTDDLQAARERRLSAVGEDQLPLGDQHALELGDDALDLVAEQPVEIEPEPEPTREQPPARRAVKKSRGRASVPSWDEIMFGGSSDSDDG